MAFEIRKIVDDNFTAPKGKPQKSRSYLTWIRALPCCVSGRYGVEAAHVSFMRPWYGHYGRGRGTKAPDLFALPLHPEAHREQHSTNEAQWWSQTGIDPHALANCLWAIYSAYPESEATVKATARINQGLALAGRLRERDLP